MAQCDTCKQLVDILKDIKLQQEQMMQKLDQLSARQGETSEIITDLHDGSKKFQELLPVLNQMEDHMPTLDYMKNRINSLSWVTGGIPHNDSKRIRS